MNEFRNRTAVITGAASGIGRGFAHRCSREGMRVVLADVEPDALARTEAELVSLNTPVLSVVTDVASAVAVQELADRALDTFGSVDLLFNNAGVGVTRTVWESTLADWEWVLGVNLWGVIHGLRTFVPIMLEQDVDCHIVNTSSLSGLVVGPGSSSPYNVSKHGVVALSETLYYELARRSAKLKVSVLCPGWVNTRLIDAERNRPATLRNEGPLEATDPEEVAIREAVRKATEQGMQPDDVAELVFQAIREEKFYVFTHPEAKEWIRAQTEDMLSERNPRLDLG